MGAAYTAPGAQGLHDRRWIIDEIAQDFTLLDVWPLPVEGSRDDFDAFLEVLTTFDPVRDSSVLTRGLFWLRHRAGAALGWDDPRKIRQMPGSAETTLSERLPTELRSAAGASGEEVGLFGGAMAERGGRIRRLYRTADEAAVEISNDTVHGVLHLGWVERGDGRYQAQLSVYVKPRGTLGHAYLKLIQPFRHLIVYPSLMRGIDRAWRGARPAGSGGEERR